MNILSEPWTTDGRTFSERIWESRANLIRELDLQMTRNILLGKSPKESIAQIATKFNKTRNQAGRLIMTESAYFSSVVQKDAFKELDIEQYEVVATLDSHTSEICLELDGKVFDIKDYQVGATAPPFHVWRRSTTVPYFDDEFSISERVARDSKGKTYYIPSNMKYKEWKNKYVVDAISIKDRGLYLKYQSTLGANAPETIEEFVMIKYNDVNRWNELTSTIKSKNYLQNQLTYIYNGQKMFIPNRTKFTSTPKVIAGEGSKDKIRVVNKLIDKYVFDVH